MEREIITGKRFGEERALYSSRGIELRNCAFQGEEDGESALKESGDVVARNCLFDLRYPMWHVDGLNIADCELTVNCRAALWYDSDVRAERCRMLGIKAFRECRGMELTNVYARSPEFGWKCSDVRMKDCDLAFEYSDVHADIKGGIDSVKNPLGGSITADGIGEIILGVAKYPCNAEIGIRGRG